MISRVLSLFLVVLVAVSAFAAFRLLEASLAAGDEVGSLRWGRECPDPLAAARALREAGQEELALELLQERARLPLYKLLGATVNRLECYHAQGLWLGQTGQGLADEAKQDEAKKTAEAAAEVSPADATTETPTAKAEEAEKAGEAEKAEKAGEAEEAEKAGEAEEETEKEAEKE